MAAVPVETQHPVARLETGHGLAHGLHRAGGLIAGNERRLRRRTHQPVEKISTLDGYPFDGDEHGIGTDLGIGKVAVFHDFGAAVAAVVHCFHNAMDPNGRV